METVHEIWVPDYDARFHCKGGSCRTSCCMGWGISLTQEEYFRLLGLACSPTLRARLDGAFHLADHPTPQRYALISPTWLGDCPLHDTDGLCMLQKECGEQALSSICRCYPRSVKADGQAIMESACSNSCEAVIELLMAQEAPLQFIRRSIQGPPRPVLHPAGGLRLPIREACIRQLQDRSAPLQDRVLRMGACLMRLESASAEELPRRLSASLQHHLPETGAKPKAAALSSLCNMMKALEPSSPSMQHFGAAAVERYGAAGLSGQALARYCADSRQFDARFPLWPRHFEHILVNHIFYEDFPFTDDRVSFSGEFLAFCGVYALLRLLSVAYMTRHEGDDALADVLAGAFRLIEHTRFYYNADRLMSAEGLNHEEGLYALLAL